MARSEEALPMGLRLVVLCLKVYYVLGIFVVFLPILNMMRE